MKYFIEILSFTGISAISQFAYSGSITDSFATGDTLTATHLNNAKAAINDNNARVNILESLTPGASPAFSGYSVSFSADGAAKNVVVLRMDLGGGETQYTIRSRYENSTEQISINGVPTVRPFIANRASVKTDNLGNVTSIGNYIEAPDTANWVTPNHEESTYDVNTLVKTVTNDTNQEVFTCSGSTAQLCTGYGTLSAYGDFSHIYTWSSIRALGGPYTFNGTARYT